MSRFRTPPHAEDAVFLELVNVLRSLRETLSSLDLDFSKPQIQDVTQNPG